MLFPSPAPVALDANPKQMHLELTQVVPTKTNGGAIAHGPRTPKDTVLTRQPNGPTCGQGASPWGAWDRHAPGAIAPGVSAADPSFRTVLGTVLGPALGTGLVCQS